MAKQIGEIIITGTIDDITFYVMDGHGYARKKSSLTGKRVKRDPKFRRTMQSANRLGKASQLASKVYRSLPRPEQVYPLFKELKSLAVLFIKQGKDEEEVMTLLQQYLAKHKEENEVGLLRNKEGVVAKSLRLSPQLCQINGEKIAETVSNNRRQKTRRIPQWVARSRRRTGHPCTGPRSGPGKTKAVQLEIDLSLYPHSDGTRCKIQVAA
jgi:hypothetical protein